MIHPCDRQTDRRAISYNAVSICYSYMLSRAKTRKMHHCETNLNKFKQKNFFGGPPPKKKNLRPPLGAFGTRVTVHFVLHTFYYLPAPMTSSMIARLQLQAPPPPHILSEEIDSLPPFHSHLGRIRFSKTGFRLNPKPFLVSE